MPRSAYSTGRVRTPWRRSVPGSLPDWVDVDATSSTSSESCQATPIRMHASAIRSVISSERPENIAPNRPEVAISDPVFSVITCM